MHSGLSSRRQSEMILDPQKGQPSLFNLKFMVYFWLLRLFFKEEKHEVLNFFTLRCLF
jgi:hypothetical protein